VYVFGGGPGLVEPWSSPEIEAMVAESDVYWNEAPKIGREALALAQRYGVDPARPLASWLTADELERVRGAAEATGVPFGAIEQLRPWLAAQILKSASETRAGLHAEYAAEVHLASVAEQHGVRVRSEFGTPEVVFETFSSWPRVVEVQRLMSTVADVEAGTPYLLRMAEAWLRGDLSVAGEMVETFERDYPELHVTLIVERNRRWVSRIKEMLNGGVRGFVVAGTAHLVGDTGVPLLLMQAGAHVEPAS
jgi:uncharacterized protein YbaP (TraB family)